MRFKFAFACVVLLTLHGITYCQKKASLFYFIIGSEHYSGEDPLATNIPNFSDLKSAKMSASIFEKTCISLGAVSGRTIYSSEDKPVTKKLISTAFTTFLEEIKTLELQNKTIFIYYYGHGLAEISTKTLFLIPGDFNVSHLKKFNSDSVSHSALTAMSFKSIVEAVDPTINFLAFLDCCYELTAQNHILNTLDSSLEYIKTETPNVATYKINDAKGLLIINAEMQRRECPAIYATSPGTSTAPLPLNKGGGIVGSLARRVFLTVEDFSKSTHLPFRDFMRKLMNPAFDPDTHSLSTLLDINPRSRWGRLLSLDLR